MTSSRIQARDRERLLEAIDLSRRCVPSNSAFSVGAVIADSEGRVLATGYSRQAGERDHAEEVAIAAASDAGHSLAGCTVYSSLEPCSRRLSGRKPCVERIIEAGAARVVIALREPKVFVNCNGLRLLEEHGIEVCILEEFAEMVREVNSHLET